MTETRAIGSRYVIINNLVITMDKIQFKAKFFGTKERKGQIKKQAEFVMAVSEDKVEDALRVTGWQTIHGLKIRKVE